MHMLEGHAWHCMAGIAAVLRGRRDDHLHTQGTGSLSNCYATEPGQQRQPVRGSAPHRPKPTRASDPTHQVVIAPAVFGLGDRAICTVTAALATLNLTRQRHAVLDLVGCISCVHVRLLPGQQHEGTCTLICTRAEMTEDQSDHSSASSRVSYDRKTTRHESIMQGCAHWQLAAVRRQVAGMEMTPARAERGRPLAEG